MKRAPVQFRGTIFNIHFAHNNEENWKQSNSYQRVFVLLLRSVDAYSSSKKQGLGNASESI
jgi:hypothetical protein